MTNFANPTKKELLAIAKEWNITGRHDMTKEDLAAAVKAYVDARFEAEMEAELQDMMDQQQNELEAEEAPAPAEKLGHKPSGKEMQAIAKSWIGSRKEFLEFVVEAGANPNSAAWHWQQGRN